MRPADIQTVSEFIADEIENRELSFSRDYIDRAKEARDAFERIIEEINERQAAKPIAEEDTFVSLGSVALRIVQGLAGKVRKDDDSSDANRPTDIAPGGDRG
jgi:hypothetical protein